MPESVPAASLAVVRERTVRDLCAHFARDHLEVEELERRLDLAYGARGRAALDALVRDLPALPAEDEGRAARPAVDPTLAVEERDLLVAVMAGAERRGEWTPPRLLTVLALMGGAELDFRRAAFGSPVTEVRVFTMMGGVEVIVPPWVRVQVNGVAVMGSFGHTAREASAGSEAPLVRITGLALMGGVDVAVRLPGESARDARRRLREGRRDRRERGRREG